jgi:hypothetical protein
MGHTNDVTLFSNGIGHFRRVYDIPAGQQKEISIPFKRDHIGDVAASLQVFGDVKLVSPPSFTPTNSNATALNINSHDAMASMLTSLSGAEVLISSNSGSEEYVLVGLEVLTRYTSNGNVEESVLVLMNETGVCRKCLNEIRDISFLQESVRTEIDKALKNNFQKIKPDSTLLDLVLSAKGDKDSKAYVQYTIPVSAWKMRYALHQEGPKCFRIEGAAIIDNCTDEDWNNFKISVVTGNPISFNTDIAEVVVPVRKMVRLVEGSALSNVEVEEGVVFSACADSRSLRSHDSVSSMGIKGSMSNYVDFGMEARHSVDGATYEVADGPTEIEAKEVGDFCIFTSKEPITILARKSAVVPMFSVKLDQAGAVLLYKEKNHSKRPYRAVKFKNETEYSLGKGKTLIYNMGVFSGECVLQATKPGENRMLAHCLENGVKIKKESRPVENMKNSTKINEGHVFEETISTASTTYFVENKKDEAFKMVMEHDAILDAKSAKVFFDGVEIIEQEKLDDGWRIYFELQPKQTVVVGVLETQVQQTKFSAHANWLRGIRISVDSPLDSLLENPQIKKCFEIQEKIEKHNREFTDLQTKLSQRESQSERLRSNIGATRDVASDQVKIWVDDLAKCEKTIEDIETRIMPNLQEQGKLLQEELSRELKKIKGDWRHLDVEKH